MNARLWRVMAATMLSIGATGCRHKVAPPPVIPPPSPAVVSPPPTENAQLTPHPAITAPLPTVTVAPKPEKKVKKTKVQAPPAVAPPVQVAAAVQPPPIAPPAAPDAGLVASLTAGGDSSQNRQKVTEMLGLVEKGISGLSPSVKDGHRDQLVRVRNFEAEAQKALGANDTEGALTLATKAKVLVDELAK